MGRTLFLLCFLISCSRTSINGEPDAQDSLDDLDGTDVSCGDCDDEDPCTVDTCNPLTFECEHVPLDADEDGYAAIESPDGTACGGDDCDDSDPDIYPGAPEVCLDGVDQDCDTVIDAFTAATDEVMLSFEGHSSWNPAIVWTDSEFGIAWWDRGDPDVDLRNEVYLARVSGMGEPVGEPVRINDDADDVADFYGQIDLAWTGSEFGVVWTTMRRHPSISYKIEFARAGPDGEKRGEDVLLRADAEYPSLEWTGSVYGLAWSHVPEDVTHEFEIYFNHFNAEGSALGEDIQVTTDSDRANRWPTLTWTGTEFGLVWKRYVPNPYFYDYNYFFNRIRTDGSLLLDNSLVDTTPNWESYPSLTWSGSMFAGAWSDIFVLIDPGGFLPAAPIEIHGESLPGYSSHIFGPSVITWTGSEYGLLVQGAIPNTNVFFYWISADGSEQSRVIQISSEDPDIGTSSHCHARAGMSWTGREFGVVWQGGPSIYFRLLGFCE